MWRGQIQVMSSHVSLLACEKCDEKKVQRKNNELSAVQKQEEEAKGDRELGGKRKKNLLRKSLFCTAADKRKETG